MQIRSVGIDLGKTTFHLVALGDKGKVLLKKKFTQKQLIDFTANLETSLIGMETSEPGFGFFAFSALYSGGSSIVFWAVGFFLALSDMTDLHCCVIVGLGKGDCVEQSLLRGIDSVRSL